MAVSYRYGIDLGTTNSSIAIVEMNSKGEKSPRVIQVDYDNQPFEVIKSIVGFKDNREIVGDNGMYRLQGTEDNPVKEIKMILISHGKDADIPAVPGKRYTDAMAAILKELKRAADNELRKAKIKPSGVVIGIPCELYNAQESIKHAYCFALYKAGFYKTLDEAKKDTIFLDEPCAVALYYGNQLLYQNKRSLIFDFGGGTLDLAIVDLKRQSINGPKNSSAHKVMSKASMYGAGGLFTEILFKDVFYPAFRDQHCGGSPWNASKFFRKMGCSAMRPDDIFRELNSKGGSCWKFIRELETAKAKLSFDMSYDFYFSCLSEDGTEDIVFDTTVIRREDFEKALEPQLLKIKEVINTRLITPDVKKEGVTKDSIEKVILAGGSSSIPCVRKTIMNMFPGKVIFDSKFTGPFYVNMMTCISQGLAIQGYYDQPTDVIDNVTSYDYGFWNGFKNKIEVVIPKNTSYSSTDIDLSRKGLIPQTKFCRDVEQVNKNASSFFVDIYEGKEKIMKLNFDKSEHSGEYRIFFRIDAGKGILEIKVYDTGYDQWIDDLDISDRAFDISTR